MSCIELIFLLLLITACYWKHIIKQYAGVGAFVLWRCHRTDRVNRMMCFTVKGIWFKKKKKHNHISSLFLYYQQLIPPAMQIKQLICFWGIKLCARVSSYPQKNERYFCFIGEKLSASVFSLTGDFFLTKIHSNKKQLPLYFCSQIFSAFVLFLCAFERCRHEALTRKTQEYQDLANLICEFHKDRWVDFFFTWLWNALMYSLSIIMTLKLSTTAESLHRKFSLTHIRVQDAYCAEWVKIRSSCKGQNCCYLSGIKWHHWDQ